MPVRSPGSRTFAADEHRAPRVQAAMESESGSPVFRARTQDSRQTFSFRSWISPPVPEGHAIRPAIVRLSGESLLTAVRTRSLHGSDEAVNSIDLHESGDRGASWVHKNRPVTDTGYGGNPPTQTRLGDGRLCITYGHRTPPFGIRAVTGSDDGAIHEPCNGPMGAWYGDRLLLQ